MYFLDSNVYIRGFNDSEFGDELRVFHSKHLPRIALSVVVAHELLAGVTTAAKERSLRRGLIDPFKARRRIHVPNYRTWELAASIDRRLQRLKGFNASLARRSFFNDILIAATARDLGAIIITENEKDFGIIGKVLDIKFRLPWP
jgi:predicted nucleic acid-binding protein